MSWKTVTFKLDGTPLGTNATNSTGRAQIGYTILNGAGAGVRTIRAEWHGDGGYLASSCDNKLTVSRAICYIWVMGKSVEAGGVFPMYAYFRRLSDYQKKVGKSVDFKVDGTFVASETTGSDGIARHSYTVVEPVGEIGRAHV